MPLQFGLGRSLIGLDREGEVRLVPWESGPPPRIDGYVVGLTRSEPGSPPRHAGERHPDADEVLVLISGRIEVLLEEKEGDPTTYEVGPGEAFVVPKGLWHRLVALEPTQLLHITPGPHGEWRPLIS